MARMTPERQAELTARVQAAMASGALSPAQIAILKAIVEAASLLAVEALADAADAYAVALDMCHDLERSSPRGPVSDWLADMTERCRRSVRGIEVRMGVPRGRSRVR